MLGSARRVPEGATLHADVCIVGGGAAGITIAQALAGSHRRVLLLESGGLQTDARTQALYAGRVEGHGQPPLDASRLRFFGGTTNHWAGLCGPLDPLDFERRPWVPHSGWPLSRETLDPWYLEAQKVCDLGPFDYGEDAWGFFAETPERIAATGTRFAITQHSTPTRFGEKYREALRRASNVQVLLHANALELVPSPDGARVARVEASTLEGRRFRVEAGAIVLACGTVENARLLLLSTGADPAGLGNARGLVGRFFLDHPRLRPAGVVLWRDADARRLAENTVRDGVKATLSLCLDRTVQKREGLLQSSLFTDAYHPPESAPGLDEADAAIAEWLALLAGDADPASLSVCWLRSEQAPRPESRVRLSDELDALGQRRVVLEWRLGELDRHTHEQAARLYAHALTRAGVASVELAAKVLDAGDDPWQRVTSDWHQMGTTRMAAGPADGVVDAGCRVFGVDNLYVAGASVFPTGGWMNPTLTLVALALRLADRLRSGT